jgi:broad specificity phosphatase PhoE
MERERLWDSMGKHVGNPQGMSLFWAKQVSGRPLRVMFIRHGESEANVDRDITRYVPDHSIHLTQKGRQQALETGRLLRQIVGDESIKFICSPYVRTKETYNGIKQSFLDRPKLQMREDCRIRELEYGNYDDANIKDFHKEKKEFGAFYYRFQQGESPADAYDRASIFLETLYRSWEDNKEQNLVIVCHGVMILVLLMRFFRINVDEYSSYDALLNGEIVCLERPPQDPKFEIEFTWAPFQEKKMGGLRRKKARQLQVWDGNLDAPMLTSQGEMMIQQSSRATNEATKKDGGLDPLARIMADQPLPFG